MLIFKYIIDHGSFTSLSEFEANLNRLGALGYELIQYKEVDRDYMVSHFNAHPDDGLLHFVITWKIESPK